MTRAALTWFILQLGLAVTFVYAGVDILLHPTNWIGWLPQWLSAISPLKDTPLLYTIGVGHIMLAALLFVPRYTRVAATLLAAFLVALLVSSSRDSWLIVYRDVGVLSAALALVVLPKKQEETASAQSTLHVSAICIRKNDAGILEVLAGKRSTLKHFYPGSWEGSAGGAVREHEDFTTAARRHLLEDYGVEARVLQPVAPFEIPASGKHPRILGIKFLCAFTGYRDGKDVALDTSEYTQWRWVAEDKLDELQWISGQPRNAKEDIREAIAIDRRQTREVGK